jgi:tetratricopeptide (TPR) repeat protein
MRALALLVVSASVAVAAPRRPVVAFLPPHGVSPELLPLALLIDARASELVEESGTVNELHLKQVHRALDEEGFSGDLLDAKVAESARLALGADRVAAFTLVAGKQLVMRGLVVDGKKPRPFTATLPTAWSGALEQGSAAVAKALLAGAPLPKKPAAQPGSSNGEALAALGRCYGIVIRQPLGVENPTVLDVTALEGAVAECTRALELDPALRFAQATQALALAILGRDEAAAKALAALGDADDVLEVYTLARFWLLTRYQSNEAGVAFLADVVKRRPGELIARSYLGETQFALGAWADAEKTWRTYVEQAPAAAFGWGRLSKALARQGRHDEAVAAAKKGFAVSPTSAEARLELGSRLLDAGRLQEAQETLEPLAQREPPKGEHLLRLGWAHWLEGELEPARAYFQRAIDVATSPGEWRTRARALYDLALVEAKRGQREAAVQALRGALQGGLKLKDVDPSLASIAREVERAEAPAGKPAPRPAALVPRESSLFPVDAFGEPDVKAKKPPAPEGLILFKF